MPDSLHQVPILALQQSLNFHRILLQTTGGLTPGIAVVVDVTVPPFTLIVPAMVTPNVVRIITGVLLAFGVKVTVTPAGILTVVKLKTPLAGTCNTVFAVGLKAHPSPYYH